MDDTTAAAYATIHAEAVRRHHRNTHVVPWYAALCYALMIADVVFLCVMASTLGNSHLTLNQKGACVIAVSVLGMIFAFLGTGLWVIADGKRPSWVWQTLTIAAILMLTISYLSLHAFDVVVHLL